MAITWILVAQGSAGKILEVKDEQKILVHKEFFHPKTAKKEALPGNKNPHDQRILPHAIDYDRQVGNHERQVFAKEIVVFLTKALDQNQFNNLIIVASRDLLGDLRSCMHHPLAVTITHELNKDLLSQHLSNDDLVKKIRDDLGLLHL